MAPKVTTAKTLEAEVQARLAEPFDPTEIKWKPQATSGNRALAIAYVDARLIMDRLDEVVGVSNWSDRYVTNADGSVSCRLRVRFGSEWITKEDVGGQSEQPDEGDRHKAAYSDALKRAAVKFGVGRYLYRLPLQWVAYDPQKRHFVERPRLPDWALPRPKNSKLPKTGQELKARLAARDATLSGQGRCKPGELLGAVLAAGTKAGHEGDLARWDEYGIALAVKVAREFEAALPKEAAA